MKVKLVGFFSFVVRMAVVLGFFRWINWLDNRSVFSLAVVLLLMSFFENVWRWLWNKREQKYDLSGEPQKPYYSSFELSGYSTIDAFCRLKKKTKTLFGDKNEMKNR
ncbi:MAG: hypothetical protein E6579_11335 [Clostridium sp.]|uniref:hypothetical protein n=1 Tax=Faecalispora jeddahensis TaxID=1414721 RepID=UPI0028A7CDF1|nr:hypothetical protein [Faecalispora jeddahensis]MDU6307243.1 hypothetical protein [Clostridium sp.]